MTHSRCMVAARLLQPLLCTCGLHREGRGRVLWKGWPDALEADLAHNGVVACPSPRPAARDALVQQHPQAVDVHLLTGRGALQGLRGHVCRGAHLGVPCCQQRGVLGPGQTKVRQAAGAVSPQQHVGGLEVAVDHT
eukprot:CAMPEP_0202896994 /NCGR_PEP_ID=MMETSP1392-20130828/5875_1 /ASSEMBLY_ACC=CAM_ASM_000868 /TAXON_ID=225041 /ORGANISM="Chlamydomonas chlamydogama, Strain SAG 11-48b" /LENGTH=135 /DNA_ID=CAMNT_0049582529 /DNA_START=296 /DNA_END=700 /DNA_ORIENTATION=-